jgi:hypothetical protein
VFSGIRVTFVGHGHGSPLPCSGGSATELSVTGAWLMAAAGDSRSLRQFAAAVCIESLTWADGAPPGRFSSLFRAIVFSGRSSVDRSGAEPFFGCRIS